MRLGIQFLELMLRRTLRAGALGLPLALHVLLSLLVVVGIAEAETPARVGESPTIAIVEDVPPVAPGSSYNVAVHVAFFRSREGWLAVGVPPRSGEWAICSNRRTAGRIATRLRSTPMPVSNLRWIHDLSSQTKFQFVGERSHLFAGWMGGYVYRPIVLNSVDGCGDPEHWRPREDLRGLWPQVETTLREVVKNIYDCDSKGKHIPFELRASDLIVEEGYVSDLGAILASVSVRRPPGLLERCELLSGPEWKSHTMAIMPDGKVAYVGAGLRFIDVGDYDGDGLSELVFQSNEYNLDGYLLAYDSFRRFATFRWSYH
jgi:hypothetical protein